MEETNKGPDIVTEETTDTPQPETDTATPVTEPIEDAAPQTETKEPQAEQAGPETVTVEKAKLEEASKAFTQMQQRVDELTDSLKRKQAEFENFRKRNASIRADADDDATRRALETLLPTLDNMERALDAATEDSPLRQGIEMTKRGFDDAMAKLGLEGIPCKVGDTFDPALHNAVMVGEPTDACPVGTILNVFQKGYQARGKVIRYAMVMVAKQ